MAAIGRKRSVQPLSAFVVATGVHVALAAGLAFMPRLDITPPQAVGGFEVVDLSAFGAAQPAEPQPVEEKVVERVQAAPEPEPLAQPEPEPAPLPVPKAVAKPEPKPQPEPKPKPVQQAKVQPKPLSKPQPKAAPAPKTQAAGSQNAFVPPSSTAAYLRNPKPSYPALAQRRGMQGVVLLFVDVAPDGTPLAVTVKKGSGYSILDKAALTAVRGWRFAPAMRGSVAVRAGVEVPIRFILNDA